MEPKAPKTYDVFVIGGGINGVGIARDAAGRGLCVGLAEMGDLASATSSASTKLFHGGLRYLEFFEVGLVRKALIEREVLLRAMPHISWPMRFVLPYHSDMRFEANTPASKLLSWVMPWMKGRRPAWMIRMGLFFYDHLGGRKILPATRTVNLRHDPVGAPLQDRFARAFEYSDCWIDDARLVVLNARDAANRGADIMVRSKVVSAVRQGDFWAITIQDIDSGSRDVVQARFLVNAGGPWVEDVIKGVAQINAAEGVRLVKGSHIVVPKIYDHDKAYFLQGGDGRIIFTIPYEEDFTLIGTTDTEHDRADVAPECSEEEADYLRVFASEYFKTPIAQDDIVWTYSGVRPLYDDGAASATAATRDYVLSLNMQAGVPMLNVFGGKITTYRKLAENVLHKMRGSFPDLPVPWTAGVPLPGGDFAVDGFDALVEQIEAVHGYLGAGVARRLARTYGTETLAMLDNCSSEQDLAGDFGCGVWGRELDWAVNQEWVRCGDDYFWRRTKLGLKLNTDQKAAISTKIASLVAQLD